ncbi:helix-turn-helix transcriptional regulator [Heliophilum fasciatum]|uniref:Transcriptional regulator n=1 Tax=Heliophilum fasciatum TaxID=35700 RepID=A0A4R2RE73_9FIRM|nr:helix-turn-helix domain-containing protein [Heliophilum fasciatum]MCW2278956.1 putative ArsR family transcriptional regulator [Heliophilum fasciatum]TCP61792.1 transcriptional regulator [Heliophilum fasciatum]
MNEIFEEAQKISSVFADKTRFLIYQFILTQSEVTYTVKTIAQKFHIHPNVARLHLSKLEEIGLLRSDWDHQTSPGRPGRVYSLRQEALTLSFPPRMYPLLSELLLETLQQLGPNEQAVLLRIGFLHGQRLAQSARMTVPALPATPWELPITALGSLLTIDGIPPNLITSQDSSATLRLRNCPFHEMLERFGVSLCALHHAILSGLITTLWPHIELTLVHCLPDGASECTLRLQLLNTDAAS